MHTSANIMGKLFIQRHHELPPVVYLAEDDRETRESITALLEEEGFVVRAASDGAELFEWLFCESDGGPCLPDVIITNQRMPGYSALDILDCLAEMRWTIPVIVLTGYASEVRSLARAYGARAVLDKPFDSEQLLGIARGCINWDVRWLRPHVGHRGVVRHRHTPG